MLAKNFLMSHLKPTKFWCGSGWLDRLKNGNNQERDACLCPIGNMNR